MRAWTRGEKIGFFSLLVALVTCGAVVISLPPVQVAAGLRPDPAELAATAAAGEELSRQLLEQQSKLLSEQLEINRVELRRMQEERMALRKQRIDHLAADATVKGKPQYDTIALRNECDFNVAVAIHYRDLDDAWITRGWWTIEPGAQVDTDAKTRNSLIFFYAENDAEGWRWDGEGLADSVTLSTVDARFDHLTNEPFPWPNPQQASFYQRKTGETFVAHVERFACLAEAPPDVAAARRVGRTGAD